MRFAIPTYLYLETRSEEEADQLKAKIEALLKSAMVDGVIKSQVGPQYIGVNVLDPVPLT